MNINNILKLFFLVTSIFILSTSFSSAETDKDSQEKNVIFILDASGSMWGQVNKVSKITIAKKKVKKLLNELPSHLNLGLMTYGHRRKSDCNDIQLFGTENKSDRSGLIEFIDRLIPRGKTPITQSIEHASNHINKGATIVLLSDGKETCGRDPCAFVKKLKSEGKDFTAHVIGFDVNKNNEAKAQLECIAKAGGGKYFNADSDQELKTAFNKIQDDLVQRFPGDVQKINRLNEQVLEIENAKKKLEQSLQTCQEELADCKKKNADLEQKINALNDTIEQLKNELGELKDINTKFKQDLAYSKDINEQLEEKNKDLNNKLVSSKDKIKKLQNNIQDLDSKLDKSLEDNKILEDQNNDLKDRIAELEREIARLKKQLNTSNKLNEKNNVLQDKLNEKNNVLQDKLNNRENIINGLRNENALLKMKLKIILGSLKTIIDSNK